MKITEKIFDVSTGEETIIEREETSEEKEQREAYKVKVLVREKELKAQAAAKAALLERLGITEEEAKLLLG